MIEVVVVLWLACGVFVGLWTLRAAELQFEIDFGRPVKLRPDEFFCWLVVVICLVFWPIAAVSTFATFPDGAIKAMRKG